MNTKQLLMTAALIATMSTAAMAQGTAPAAKMAPSAATTADQDHKAKKEQKFEERKTKILQRLGERADKIQKKQACVQAATTPDALKACFPKMGERGEKHGERGSDKK